MTPRRNPHRRGTSGQPLSWFRADFVQAQAVTLVSAVSRHAKDSTLPYGLRAQLYSVKAAGIHALFVQGRLLPDHVSSGRWRFGEDLRSRLATSLLPQAAHLIARLDLAEQTATPLDSQALLAAGLDLIDLPIPNLHRGSTLRTLSASQRSHFDPRGSWLVGFSELPGGEGAAQAADWCDLHQPYRLVERWTGVNQLPFTPEERLIPGSYGRPPDRAFRRKWPLAAVLAQLNVTGLNRSESP